MLVYWTQTPASFSVPPFLTSVTENRLNDSNLLTDTCLRQSSSCFCFRTCRKSFHRTAPLGAETSDSCLALPTMEPLSASASVSPAPATATCASITRADWTRRCLRHSSPQSGPANFSAVRTCDAGPLAQSFCVHPPRIPHFRYSRLLGNQNSGVTSLHQFSGGHLK